MRFNLIILTKFEVTVFNQMPRGHDIAPSLSAALQLSLRAYYLNMYHVICTAFQQTEIGVL